MSVDRLATLLYGVGEAAGCLAIPPSTLTTWAYGYQRRRAGARNASAKPIVTAVRPERAGDLAMPFIDRSLGRKAVSEARRPLVESRHLRFQLS
jgi:hypothetical protein